MHNIFPTPGDTMWVALNFCMPHEILIINYYYYSLCFEATKFDTVWLTKLESFLFILFSLTIVEFFYFSVFGYHSQVANKLFIEFNLSLLPSQFADIFNFH